MASETDVANLALTLMGQPRVLSLNDDRTGARTLKAVWDIERQATIRDGSWNFATRRAELPASPDAVSHPFAFGYPMPTDFLKLAELFDHDNDPWQLEGRVILSDRKAPIYIRYLRDVPEMAEWDASAVEAFAHRLALACGEKLAGSAFDGEGVLRKYRLLTVSAKSADAMENPSIEQAESSWIEARNFGGYTSRWGRPGWEIW